MKTDIILSGVGGQGILSIATNDYRGGCYKVWTEVETG